MDTSTYRVRRGEIEQYFDRTALQAWEQLTGSAPVGRIRATVRAGRERMRQTLLDWLPADLSGRRILDAGCGTGAFALAAARRGAEVVAIDLSPSLVRVARDRAARMPASHEALARVDWRSGDFSDPALGGFDHVVAMDSLIHYRSDDALRVLQGWAPRVARSMLFTFAPSTPLLGAMHAVGRLFPRGQRAPSIVPVSEQRLRAQLALLPAPWRPGRSQRIVSGFYTSQAFEVEAPRR